MPRGMDYDDDIDDIMSQIMHDAPPRHIPKPQPKDPPKIQPKLAPRRRPLHVTHPITHSNTKAASETPKKARKPKARGKVTKFLAKSLLVLSILAIGAGGGYLLYQGPLQSILEPKSPFKNEVISKVEFPLYYPTELPEGFKIETDNVTQPDSDVVMYAITNDSGKRVNITLQKQPAGISLDPLYAVLTEITETNTEWGTFKTGLTTDGVQVTNILTGNTWIIINANKGVIDKPQLDLLIGSLKEAKS